jgi:hypothetical protein
MHVYEIRPRKDHRGVDLISDALPFGRLWYGEPNAVSNAIGYFFIGASPLASYIRRSYILAGLFFGGQVNLNASFCEKLS